MNDEELLFIETEPDTWLGVKEIPTHDAIHEFLTQETEASTYHMRVASRAFNIDSRLKDFKELATVKEGQEK